MAKASSQQNFKKDSAENLKQSSKENLKQSSSAIAKSAEHLNETPAETSYEDDFDAVVPEKAKSAQNLKSQAASLSNLKSNNASGQILKQSSSALPKSVERLNEKPAEPSYEDDFDAVVPEKAKSVQNLKSQAASLNNLKKTESTHSLKQASKDNLKQSSADNLKQHSASGQNLKHLSNSVQKQSSVHSLKQSASGQDFKKSSSVQSIKNQSSFHSVKQSPDMIVATRTPLPKSIDNLNDQEQKAESVQNLKSQTSSLNNLKSKTASGQNFESKKNLKQSSVDNLKKSTQSLKQSSDMETASKTALPKSIDTLNVKPVEEKEADAMEPEKVKSAQNLKSRSTSLNAIEPEKVKSAQNLKSQSTSLNNLKKTESTHSLKQASKDNLKQSSADNLKQHSASGQNLKHSSNSVQKQPSVHSLKQSASGQDFKKSSSVQSIKNQSSFHGVKQSPDMNVATRTPLPKLIDNLNDQEEKAKSQENLKNQSRLEENLRQSADNLMNQPLSLSLAQSSKNNLKQGSGEKLKTQTSTNSLKKSGSAQSLKKSSRSLNMKVAIGEVLPKSTDNLNTDNQNAEMTSSTQKIDGNGSKSNLRSNADITKSKSGSESQLAKSANGSRTSVPLNGSNSVSKINTKSKPDISAVPKPGKSSILNMQATNKSSSKLEEKEDVRVVSISSLNRPSSVKNSSSKLVNPNVKTKTDSKTRLASNTKMYSSSNDIQARNGSVKSFSGSRSKLDSSEVQTMPLSPESKSYLSKTEDKFVSMEPASTQIESALVELNTQTGADILSDEIQDPFAPVYKEKWESEPTSGRPGIKSDANILASTQIESALVELNTQTGADILPDEIQDPFAPVYKEKWESEPTSGRPGIKSDANILASIQIESALAELSDRKLTTGSNSLLSDPVPRQFAAEPSKSSNAKSKQELNAEKSKAGSKEMLAENSKSGSNEVLAEKSKSGSKEILAASDPIQPAKVATMSGIKSDLSGKKSKSGSTVLLGPEKQSSLSLKSKSANALNSHDKEASTSEKVSSIKGTDITDKDVNETVPMAGSRSQLGASKSKSNPKLLSATNLETKQLGGSMDIVRSTLGQGEEELGPEFNLHKSKSSLKGSSNSLQAKKVSNVEPESMLKPESKQEVPVEHSNAQLNQVENPLSDLDQENDQLKEFPPSSLIEKHRVLVDSVDPITGVIKSSKKPRMKVMRGIDESVESSPRTTRNLEETEKKSQRGILGVDANEKSQENNSGVDVKIEVE
jgi:hypothetical protein